VITQAATDLSPVAAAVVAHAEGTETAPAMPGAVLFWGVSQPSASASASAPAPSLVRSTGEGWGGVVFAPAVAVAVAVAAAVAPAFALPGPLPQRRSRRTRPRRGDVQGCTSFFDETGTSRRKIPAAEWTRGAQRRGRGGRVCFLWATFLCTSKERCARAPKGSESSCLGLGLGLGFSFRSDLQKTAKARAKAFSPLRGASCFSLLVQRKDNQKKRLFNSRMAGQAHPAYAPSALRAPGPLRWQDFSTIHPCIVEKRRASLHVAPLGVLSASSVAAEGDPVEQHLEQQRKQEQLQELPLPNPPGPQAQPSGRSSGHTPVACTRPSSPPALRAREGAGTEAKPRLHLPNASCCFRQVRRRNAAPLASAIP